jgi:adenylate cyclase
MKDYNDSILEATSGVMTPTRSRGHLQRFGRASSGACRVPIGEKLDGLLDEERVDPREDRRRAFRRGERDLLDATVTLSGVERSVNLTIMPLMADDGGKEIGSM